MTTPTRWATMAQLDDGEETGPDLRGELWRHLDAQLAADCRARCDAYAAAHDDKGLHRPRAGGRDRLVDAYQEALDLVTYLELVERGDHWAFRWLTRGVYAAAAFVAARLLQALQTRQVRDERSIR